MQQSKYAKMKIIHAMRESKYGLLPMLPHDESSDF